MENKYRYVCIFSDYKDFKGSVVLDDIIRFLAVGELASRDNMLRAVFNRYEGYNEHYLFLETDKKINFKSLSIFLGKKYSDEALKQLELLLFNTSTNKFHHYNVDRVRELDAHASNSSWYRNWYKEEDARLSIKALKLLTNRLKKGYTGSEVHKQFRKQAERKLIPKELNESISDLIHILGIYHLSSKDAITVCDSVISLSE